MTITCEIVTESASNAITVPSTAVRSYGDISYAMVAADRTLEEKAHIRNAILKNNYESLIDYLTVETSDTRDEMQMPADMEDGAMPEGFDAENIPKAH